MSLPIKPKKADRRYRSDGGPVVCMAAVDGWVMARRPGCLPFVVTLREWDAMPKKPPVDPGLAL